MNNTYYPILPTSNRILQKKWDQKYYSAHRDLVRDARPSIDTRPPKTFMHLHMKLKKLQLEEERMATIERDNRILLEKMTHIMRTTGSVNNRNDYEPKSLNEGKRRKELLRVSKDNATLAKRITELKPENGRDAWKSSWSRNTAYMDNISKTTADWRVSKSSSRQSDYEKTLPKRSESLPREDKKGIQALVMTNETTTATATVGNKSKQ